MKSKNKLAEENPLQRLKRWGPLRRWSIYWDMRRFDYQFWRDRDPEENARGRLPDDEGVQLPEIWVAELYTPSTVGGLLAGIRELGWEYGKSRDDSLTEWMNNVREGRQAGWISLGLVSPPEASSMMRERTAPLPPGSKAALPILMSLTPSLTSFIVCFIFDDDTAASLEAPLRAEYMTTTRRDPLFHPWHIVRFVLMNDSVRIGHRTYTPNMIRQEEVKSRLQTIEKNCIWWVHERFPGVFSSIPNKQTPTAILLVTEQVKPMSSVACDILAFDGLAIDRDYAAWESDQWPGARLVMPEGWDDEGKRLTFACRRRDAFPDSPGYHNSTSNWTIAHRANDFIRGVLSRWAITCLLDSYHELLSVQRDQTAHDSKYRPVRDLKKLRSLARTTLYDIGACTQEILDFSKSDIRYCYDVLDMSYTSEKHEEKHELLNNLRSSQAKRALQVQREAALLQSTLSTSNSLSQTISNIRIQRLLALLAVVSIGVAIWAAYFAFRSVS